MKRLCSLLVTLPLAACSTDGFELPSFSSVASLLDPTRPETQTLSGPIETVSRPDFGGSENITVSSLTGDGAKSFTVRPYGNGVRVSQSDGCVWTRSSDWFSPSDSWANCGDSKNWHTAQAQVRELDSLYPLKVGSTGRYQRSAVSHTGRSYTRETRCTVTDAVEVVRSGHAATPAYVVECDDSRRLRTTWYAPGEGPIAYRERHFRNGVEEAWVRVD